MVKGKEVLVIDLGSYCIKALMGKRTATGVSVRWVTSIPISPGIYGNGEILDAKVLTEVLKELVQTYQIKKQPVVFTFGSTGSFVRVLDVPLVAPTEMGRIIEFEMQQYLPGEPGNYGIQYRGMGREQRSSEAQGKILAGTVPNSFAQALLSIAADCGLVPLALDIHTNAIEKVVSYSDTINERKGLSDETIALVEIGHTLIDVSIFEKGEFQFNRRISGGGKDMDQRLQRALGITHQDAHVSKHTPLDITIETMDYSEESRIRNAMRSGVDEWVAEIEKVFRFYQTRKTGNHIDRCYVYGGSSVVIGLEAYMGKHFDIPVEIIRGLSLVDTPAMTEKADAEQNVQTTGIRMLDDYLVTDDVYDKDDDNDDDSVSYGRDSRIRHFDEYVGSDLFVAEEKENPVVFSGLNPEMIPNYMNAIGALIRRGE